jgi:hypothetical protein
LPDQNGFDDWHLAVERTSARKTGETAGIGGFAPSID